MAFMDELKTHWASFAVLFLAAGMKNLVNQVEVAFARSLVWCEEPLTGEYTGSPWCGNRWHVLSVGYGISQRGQAQESFAMLIAILMVAVLSTVFGRKIVLLIGLAGTTISVVLFILACALPQWSWILFVMGQGLQGLLPIDHLAGLIIFDLSVKGGGMATYQVKGLLDTIGNFLWGPILGNCVQYLELVNYSTVWIIILLVNLSVFLVALFLMPESMYIPPEKKDDDDHSASGAFSKVVREVISYKDVWYNPLSWRFLLMVCIEPCWMHSFGIVPIQLMAYHGWSQSAVVLLILVQPLFLVFFGVVPALCLRIGFTRMMTISLVYLYSVLIIMNLSVAVSDLVPLMMLMAFTLVGGFMPVKEYVDSRFSTPDQMARFKSVQWIIGYILGMGIGPVYASVFNAAAQTYIPRSLPNILAVILMLIQCAHVRVIMYPYMRITLNLMDELEEKQKKLFLALKKSDNPVIPLDKATWTSANLEKHLGKSFEDAYGPFPNVASFREFAKRESGGTNAEGKVFIEKLDAALASLEPEKETPEKETKKEQ